MRLPEDMVYRSGKRCAVISIFGIRDEVFDWDSDGRRVRNLGFFLRIYSVASGLESLDFVWSILGRLIFLVVVVI